MKVLITGGTGQLGTSIAELLKRSNINYVAPTSKEMDITDFDNVKNYIMMIQPQVIIHCAAYTAVDLAEDERKACYTINVVGTENLVEASQLINATLIYISTDYVFDGTILDSYKEIDAKHPINYYGECKSEAEDIIINRMKKYFIFRVSWLFGPHGTNFVKTMLRLGKVHNNISIVDDQIGAPTYTGDVAYVIKKAMNSIHYGVYHISNEGRCSWADFAIEIFKQANILCEVLKIRSDQYPMKAKRPQNSKLDSSKLKVLGVPKLPLWQESLNTCLIQLGEQVNDYR